MKKLIDEIKKSKNGKTIGVFAKENYPGVFADMWRSALTKENFESVSFCWLNVCLLSSDVRSSNSLSVSG